MAAPSLDIRALPSFGDWIRPEFGRFTDYLPLRLAARKIAEGKIRRCLQPSLTSSMELPGRKTVPLLSLSWRSRAASAALIQQTSAGTILKAGLAKLWPQRIARAWS